MMPNDFLSTLWELWRSNVIEVAHVVQALSLYGYELSYIGNGGLTASKEREIYKFIVS
jgi:TPP-dependent trihydroxycyclohexane-1,2-dione (THcHDO) dehydratase